MLGKIKNSFSLLSSKLCSRLLNSFVYSIRTNDFNFRIYINTRHERFRARTFETKEPDTLSFISYFGNIHDVSLIDIGANIGIYSLAFASKSNSPVYAFEFDPSSQVSLIKNLSLNNFKNITPVLAALDSSKNFSLLPTFYQIFEAGAGAGGLNKIYASVKSSNECLQTLTPSLSLDVFNSIHPFPGESVLKIDTDGHELDILLGSKDLLRSGKILAIILEINSFAYSEADVTDLLTTFGYCLVARSKWCQQLSEGSIYNCVFLKSDSSNDVIDYFKNNCHFEI